MFASHLQSLPYSTSSPCHFTMQLVLYQQVLYGIVSQHASSIFTSSIAYSPIKLCHDISWYNWIYSAVPPCTSHYFITLFTPCLANTISPFSPLLLLPHWTSLWCFTTQLDLSFCSASHTVSFHNTVCSFLASHIPYPILCFTIMFIFQAIANCKCKMTGEEVCLFLV